MAAHRDTPRIAIVHEWLVSFAGSEKALQHILRRFPEADLYTVLSIMDEADAPDILSRLKGTTSIQRLPFLRKMYRKYLPLMPLAIEQLDLSGYDLVISSHHAVAKGVITGPDQLHISYVHSPMRYAWDLQNQYLRESGMDRGIKGFMARRMLHRLRLWDASAANRVDRFLANSHYIRRRIDKAYRRDAEVIYPPVDVDWFSPGAQREAFYMTASRFVPYKRISLIVEAFAQMPERTLIVIGDGPDMDKIARAKSDNVTLLGHQPNEVLRDHMRRAKAFVFAAEEDFGIVPLEAQACGAPVIAFGRGGGTETVVPLGMARPTGVHFPEQTISSLIEAVDRFEANADAFSVDACRDNAERFSAPRFEAEFGTFVMTAWQAWRETVAATVGGRFDSKSGRAASKRRAG